MKGSISCNKERSKGRCGKITGSKECFRTPERPICTGVFIFEFKEGGIVKQRIEIRHSPCPGFRKKIKEMEDLGFLYIFHGWCPKLYRQAMRKKI